MPVSLISLYDLTLDNGMVVRMQIYDENTTVENEIVKYCQSLPKSQEEADLCGNGTVWGNPFPTKVVSYIKIESKDQ